MLSGESIIAPQEKEESSMKESRRKQIESLLAERRSISMHELCEALNVSMNTVRADVSSLVREGVVEWFPAVLWYSYGNTLSVQMYLS